ncbi:hypothetical protein [Streptomyces sp. NBC_00151]|uniref:hypothetical protein n=1 Tax=Streptomyces sp. NBC_00151 TaxID=2975669 RepID=UPI002DDA13EE|nr:hypothetical protein [Streptomyces sp. NBC_00151]WRZ42274.1 hypothetical protein OG915_32090 [Streptomyces sp. NBC_00151]
MAGRRCASRAGLSVVLLLAGLVGCGGRAAPDTAAADVQRVLDRRAAAVLDRDDAAFRATGAAAGAGTGLANLRDVPLAGWSYRLAGLSRSGDSATARAELRYRIAGYDTAPVEVDRTLALTRAGGTWRVTSDKPSGKGGDQLWDEGAVTAVRGEHSLVLGVGQSGERLRAFAGLADRAVPAVSDAWGADWSRHVVVLVPKSLEGMAGLLGAPASGYRGIAAVTTGEAGPSAKAPADRIIVNPDAYGVLGGLGKQVVLTHETTHVATRAHTTAATPLWLSEGYADWAGYRGSGRAPGQVAPELQRAVAEGRVPAALPDDKDFGFTADAGALARAYEGGWMACRLIADHWGEVRLNDFYRAVGDHGKREGAVEDALRDVLDTTPERFAELWRQYLGDQLG